MTLFNPDLQMKICRDDQLCFFGDAPILSEINMAYGEMTSTMWLIPQLYDLSEYCGVKDKLEGKSLEECASVIASEFYFLKVSELMLFFHRFKSGRYGKLYGSVDPLAITTSLREFLKERAREIERRKSMEMEAEERESRKNAISRDEYIAKYGKEDNVKSASLKSLVDRAVLRSKDTPTVLSEEDLTSMAKGIVENIYNVDKDTLEALRDSFTKHKKVTPEEYLRTYGGKS